MIRARDRVARISKHGQQIGRVKPQANAFKACQKPSRSSLFLVAWHPLLSRLVARVGTALHIRMIPYGMRQRASLGRHVVLGLAYSRLSSPGRSLENSTFTYLP